MEKDYPPGSMYPADRCMDKVARSSIRKVKAMTKAVKQDKRDARLQEWLLANDARCQWEKRIGPGLLVGAYLIKRGVVIVTEFTQAGGFDLYTAPNTNEVAATFTDALQRVS